MQVSDFPLTVAGLGDNPRRVAQLTKWVEVIGNAAKAGEIANAEYVDMKFDMSRVLEAAWRGYEAKFDRSLFSGWDRERRLNRSDKLNDLLVGFHSPTFHLTSGQIKKLEKIAQKENDPAIAPMLAFLREIEPFCVAVVFLKDKTVKRKTLSDEEREAAKYAAPVSSSKAVETVKGVLTNAVDQQYQNMLNMFIKSNRATLADFQAGLAEAGDDITKNAPSRYERSGFEQYYSVKWHFTRTDAFGRTEVDSRAVSLLMRVVKQSQYSKPMTEIAPNADAILVDEATKRAKEIRDLFIVKNLRKIVSILEAKTDDVFDRCEVIDSTISLSGLEGVLRFFFKDGSGFTCRNGVVFAVSNKGTPFYRFPLTFHNVSMPGGTKMPSPSEKRMNTFFLGKPE